jgi:predicted unusual protein kinase regulating ubiquinone biosynthesis (AarF/ABC1/UbiB family)
MAQTVHGQNAQSRTGTRVQPHWDTETFPPGNRDVVRSMPRRKVRHTAGATVTLPRARRVTFKAGLIRPIGRMFTWAWGAIRFVCGNFGDILLRRDTTQRRAVRLRRIFESTGASISKLGQQLSLRADILPYAYCAELGKMLDRAPPFPTAEAIASIERNLGLPLHEIFEAFDPDPIGSASLACVYQANLRSGERVAVKVRRPGIGPLIAADLRAFDWLLSFAEAITLLQPGLTTRFRRNIRTILFNEMNFRAEARYIDLFRRRSRKRRSDVTAPKVYFEYCTEEILVSEFVSGVWMWELMAAVDANDEEFLAQLLEQGIEPKSLARKLINVMHQEVLEEIFFHADPHPANIVVRPNNGICFVDFGAVGRFSTETRKAWRELMHHMRNGDITRMVNCSLSLSGPLPPIDVERVGKEIEEIYADWVYAQRSSDAEWWERSTAQAWLRYIEVARKFAIPVNLETIQFFRATFLYDSIVTRLDKNIDLAREFHHYIMETAQDARRRVQQNLKKRVWGLTDMDYLQIEQIADSATQFMFQLQRRIEHPIVQFRNVVGKIAYTASLLLRLGYLAAVVLVIALLADSIAKYWFDYEINWSRVLEKMTTFGWVQIISIVLVLIVIRRIVIKLNQPDFRPDYDR